MPKDEIDGLLSTTTKEISETKNVLQDLVNEVAALCDVVSPALDRQIGMLRTARMATVNEIRETLVALREIRKFFTEENHNKEMAELERFVALCKELQSLKAAGLFDAVADTMIRMKIGEDRS